MLIWYTVLIIGVTNPDPIKKIQQVCSGWSYTLHIPPFYLALNRFISCNMMPVIYEF